MESKIPLHQPWVRHAADARQLAEYGAQARARMHLDARARRDRRAFLQARLQPIAPIERAGGQRRCEHGKPGKDLSAATLRHDRSTPAAVIRSRRGAAGALRTSVRPARPGAHSLRTGPARPPDPASTAPERSPQSPVAAPGPAPANA